MEYYYDKLNLYKGMPLDMQLGDRKDNIVVKISEYGRDGIRVVPSEGNEFPAAAEDDDVILRGFISGTYPVTLFGRVGGASALSILVRRIRVREDANRRENFRQHVSSKLRVTRLDENGGPAGGPVEAQSLDVSTGGIRFRGKGEYEVGDRLRVEGLYVSSDAPFSMDCTVCWRESVFGGLVMCGCQFGRLTARQESRLYQEIVEAERKEIQRRREGGR